jgi:hypothetical protein
MALIIKDRIKEVTTTTGTGDIVLGGSSATYDSFGSCMSNGDTTYYAIVHTVGGTDEWEVGLGTYNSTTDAIARTTISASSNAGSAVNFSAGPKNIFITNPADKAVYLNADGNIDLAGTIDGRDLSVDGAKLDGIEAGATADQTKADIDALNINADLLDGQHGSYYTSYTDTAVANLVDSSPATLDTLNELAAALGDDPNFATTVTNSIATKLPLAGGTMTGDITFNSTQLFDGRDVSADGATLDTLDTEAWRKGTDIPSGANLNNYTSDGYYHQNSNSNAAAGSNYPVDYAGMLEVTSDGNMVYQRYTVYNSTHDVYVRTYYNGTWYSWSKQWSDANDDTLLKTTGGTMTGDLDITGTLTAEDLRVTSSYPLVRITDSDGTNQILDILESNGVAYYTSRNNTNHAAHLFRSWDGTTYLNRLHIASNGDSIFYDDTAAEGMRWDASTSRLGIGTDNPSQALDVVGNIAVSGTVDGFDISTLQTALDGKAALAGSNTQEFSARTINLANLEKSNLGSDGELGFDSSQGLLVYRTQQGTTGTVSVLDGANVDAGTGMSISNLGTGGTGTESFTFDVTSDVMRHKGSIGSQDWNTFIDGTESSYYDVLNMTGSNKPPAYEYGLAVNYAVSGRGKLQIYAPHNGSDGDNGLWFRSGWNTDYDNWAEIWHSNNDSTLLKTTGGTMTGNLTISNGAPSVRLVDTDATSTHSVSWMVRNGDNFEIQTRSSSDNYIASPYLIRNNQYGAWNHEFKVGTTNILEIDSSGAQVTGDVTASGKFIANSYVRAGNGSGGVSLTHNDGYGNANVTFNHEGGVPEQNGNAGRIEVDTDGTVDASMTIELKSNVTGGSAVSLTTAARFSDTDQILYYAGSDKLRTTSSGVDVTGDLTIASGANSKITFDNSTSSTYDAVIQNAYDYDAWLRFVDGGGTCRLSIGRDNQLYVGGYGVNGHQVWHAGNDSTLLKTTGGTMTGTLNMNNNVITNVEDIALNDRIYHDDDTNTYMQFHASDQWRVVTGGAERLECNNNGTTISSGNLYTNDVRARSSNLNFRDVAGNVTCYFAESADTWLWRPNGTNERMRLNNTGLGVKNSSPNVALDVGGSIEYTGTITDVSDDRLKENKVQITGALDAIRSLTGYTYNMVYEDDNQTEMGLIAQDVQAVLPVAVKNIKVDTDGDGTDEDYLGVSYIQLIAPMIEAMKEQQQQIEALEARLAVLEG